METKIKKKLIEVALPLEAINAACINEGSPFTPRHPRSLHVWWARRRLAAARAVIFSQMVDDPSAWPDLFPSEKTQEKERKRLFKIIQELVLWENTTNESMLDKARGEIWNSWRRTCAENVDHPQAKEIFNRNKLPEFHDPFAGGGALPLEAQRLGLVAHASDLNPVAVLINKAMIEIPSKFSGFLPVNPEFQNQKGLFKGNLKGAEGLSKDVHYYGQCLSDLAEKGIGRLYPKIRITPEIVSERPDLKQYIGRELTVLAYIWARTVKSPNPAFATVEVPLATTFLISTKPGKEAYVEPVIDGKRYEFKVKIGNTNRFKTSANGTAAGKRNAFNCLMSKTPIDYEYIRIEAKAGRMGARLMAIVVEGDRERLYLSPIPEIENIAKSAVPKNVPDTELPPKALGFRVQEYGMLRWRDLFTPRQIEVLATFSDLIQEVREQVKRDAVLAGMQADEKSLAAGGDGASAYADAVVVYFGLAISRWTDLFCSLSSWNSTNQNIKNLFSRQAVPMVWDFAESNPFGNGVSFKSTIETIYKLFISLPSKPAGFCKQVDARVRLSDTQKIISTDPPYYDNIGYADLSDFFYFWLRRSMKPIFPELFSTLVVPKAEELVATPFRHGNKEKAETFFLNGMTEAMHQLAEETHPAFPVTIYYAFKQTESKDDKGSASTGWETFLDAVIRAGFTLTGTWPLRTERIVALKKNINALATSVVLVCRKRDLNAPSITRREFIALLKGELPQSLINLQRGNIAPVDLAQAAIGPGMAIYSRFSKVLDASGKELTVREALTLINEVLDETLAQQEGDFDSDSRWALTWFEQYGFSESDYGEAEQLSKAKNTSVSGMVEAGILSSSKGKVRLLKPDELADDWDPLTDNRLTSWETVHHLIRVLEDKGETEAAVLAKKLGSKAELARELAYRLYTICERKKRAKEALSYNALVQSWPEINRLAQENAESTETQIDAFN
jgi:putative DNA methylase